tara:strand:- start:4044 stop:4706 length:663 start_codon:yes stop_codon:yes gene_type:complete
MDKLIKQKNNYSININNLIVVKDIRGGGTATINMVKDNDDNLFIYKRLKNVTIYYNKLHEVPVDNQKNYINEINSLKKLSKYHHFTSLIDYNNIAYNKIIQNEEVPENVTYDILMTYCGNKLDNVNIPENWKEQILNIYSILELELIYHNDIGSTSNLCVLNDTIYLIDFGESTTSIGYPYFNLSLNIIKESNTIEEMFLKIRTIGLSIIACLYIRKKKK